MRWSLRYCHRFAAATAVVTRMLQPTSELLQCLLMSLICWLLITLVTARYRLLLMPLRLFFFLSLLLFLAKLLTVQRCLRLLLLLLQLQKMEAACFGDEVAAVVVSDAGGCSDVAAFGCNHSYPQSPW